MSPTFWLPSIQDHGGFGSFKIKAPFQGEAALVLEKFSLGRNERSKISHPVASDWIWVALRIGKRFLDMNKSEKYSAIYSWMIGKNTFQTAIIFVIIFIEIPIALSHCNSFSLQWQHRRVWSTSGMCRDTGMGPGQVSWRYLFLFILGLKISLSLSWVQKRWTGYCVQWIGWWIFFYIMLRLVILTRKKKTNVTAWGWPMWSNKPRLSLCLASGSQAWAPRCNSICRT